MPTYSGPRGSGFVGLGHYLNLNREAGQRMGANLANEVEQQGAAARSAIDAASATFNERAQAGTPQFQQNSPQAMLGGYSTAAYRGPGELREVANVDALGQQADAAGERANMAATQEGRMALMQQLHGQGSNYTAGMGMLDAALAGQGAGGRLEAARNAYGNLRGYLGLAETGAKARAEQGRKEAEGVKNQYASALQSTPLGGTQARQQQPQVPGMAGNMVNRYVPQGATPNLERLRTFLSRGRPQGRLNANPIARSGR